MGRNRLGEAHFGVRWPLYRSQDGGIGRGKGKEREVCAVRAVTPEKTRAWIRHPQAQFFWHSVIRGRMHRAFVLDSSRAKTPRKQVHT
eukprot:5038890-Pleurochrysis_carterae.AAC.4